MCGRKRGDALQDDPSRSASGQQAWHEARLTWSGRRAEIAAAGHSFFIESDAVAQGDHGRADFAAFGLAILSMSAGVAIRLDQPVSHGVAGALQRLAQAFDLWQWPGLHPLRLWLPHIAPDVVPQGDARIICASGGVDSTSSAIEARAEGFTHGLLIAGADYPHDSVTAYGELKDRVEAICRTLGLTLIEVRTSLRQAPCNWEMLHTLGLAMCLYFVSPGFRAGGFALDNSLTQDLARHPWGNSAALAWILGSGPFPIHGYGQHRDRIDKLRLIAAQTPQLVGHLAVCWRDTGSGGNCGACEKCTWTRLALLCCGLDESVAFPAAPPLAEAVRSRSVPARLYNVRGMYVRLVELLWHLPEGPEKALVGAHIIQLRKVMRQMERGEIPAG